MGEKYYQIEEVAVKTGLTKRTLRYYEDIELINPMRTEAGYRLYSEEDIEILLRILEIKDNLGFCLGDIKAMLGLEENLKDVFNGETRDSTIIKSSIEALEEQLEKIQKKERSLTKLKLKCEDTINKLRYLSGN
jgi:MerR family transcriptional regulator, repressor of the yfmOP operon